VRSASLENFLRIPFCTCGACSVPPYDRGLTSVCRSCSRLRAETQLSRIGYKCADAERTKVEELGAAGTEGDLPVSGGVLENKIRTALNASIVQAGEKFLRLRAQAWLCRPFTFQKCCATERRAPCKPLTRNRTIRPQLGWRCSLCTDCRLQHAGTRNAQLRRVRCSGDLIPPYGTTHERTLPPPNPPPPPPPRLTNPGAYTSPSLSRRVGWLWSQVLCAGCVEQIRGDATHRKAGGVPLDCQ
jgi:hypothetical protein